MPVIDVGNAPAAVPDLAVGTDYYCEAGANPVFYRLENAAPVDRRGFQMVPGLEGRTVQLKAGQSMWVWTDGPFAHMVYDEAL